MMLGKKKKEIYPKTGSTSHEFVDFFILKQYYFIKIGLTNLSWVLFQIILYADVIKS